MNKNQAEGTAKVVTGEIERVVGGALGDGEMQVRGGVREGAGYVQEAAGSVQEAVEQLVGQARALVSKASNTYRQVSDTTHDIARSIENRPFVAVTVAATLGLLSGLLIAGGGPKIVYLKPEPRPT